MKFAKAPRCLYDEIHAQRAYFAAFVQFAKQEDVNLHMKELASFASLREIKSIHPGWPSKGEAPTRCESVGCDDESFSSPKEYEAKGEVNRFCGF